jgi:hypothetical protein
VGANPMQVVDGEDSRRRARRAINVASLMILPLAGRPCHVPACHAQHGVYIDVVEAIPRRKDVDEASGPDPMSVGGAEERNWPTRPTTGGSRRQSRPAST